MRLEQYPASKLKKEILTILARYIDLTQYRVFFFGSRVTGAGTSRSDIDIGIEGPHPLSGRVLADIQEDINTIRTLYKIDIVDFASVGEKFRDVVGDKKEYISSAS